jgi:hypothetical protein
MNLRLICIVGLVALTTGCRGGRTALRTSSRQSISEADSRIVLVAPEQDVVRRLREMFGMRGLQLVDRQPYETGNIYVFKGRRQSSRIGSIYYVLVKSQGDNTRLELFGKPTLDDKAGCSNQDPPWVTDCERVVVKRKASSKKQMTGREEAEAIRSLLLELELGSPDAPGFAVMKTPEPGPMEPTCIAEELPEWNKANAPEKRELLRQCAQPKPKTSEQATAPAP